MTAKMSYLKVMLLLLLQCCCLVVEAVTQGSGDLELILSLQMPCLRLGRSLQGTPSANWAAVHPEMRLERKQTGARPWRHGEKDEGTWKSGKD